MHFGLGLQKQEEDQRKGRGVTQPAAQPATHSIAQPVLMAQPVPMTQPVPMAQPVVAMAAVPVATPAGSFCPHCGKPNGGGARFCKDCGKALPSADVMA